jgi:hypothetical protein
MNKLEIVHITPEANPGESATPPRSQAATLTSISKLEECVTQYDILKRIVRQIHSIDLWHLAFTSTTSWNSIRNTRSRWLNLTSRTSCDGYGIGQRHKSGQYYIMPSEHRPAAWHIVRSTSCASGSMKPCTRCGFNTCDECRAHLSYGAWISRTNPSGRMSPRVGHFMMLDDVLRFGDGRSQWWIVMSGDEASFKRHDIAPLQPFINYGLSLQPVTVYNVRGQENVRLRHNFYLEDLWTAHLHELSVAHGPFAQLTEIRKRYLCSSCAPLSALQNCSCTLSQRFRDTWTCLRCIERDVKKDVHYRHSHSWTWEIYPGVYPTQNGHHWRCVCGSRFIGVDDPVVVCSWCQGKITYLEGP